MNTENLKKVGVPVAIGFVATGLILAVLKSRFGIEIGDPVDLEDAATTEQPDPNAAA